MEWISVKDRLPDIELNNLSVLVWAPSYHVQKAWIRYDGTNLHFWQEICGYDGGFAQEILWVTHWQPLPEPPKE